MFVPPPFPIAHGAAAALAAGAAVDDGLPFVACAAAPPDAFSAAWGDILRSEAAIFRGVPFFGYSRVEGGEVVEPCQHFLIRTVGAAAAALGAAGDDRLIVVALVAAPPHFAIAGWGDVFRREGTIFCRVPLTRDVRILTGQIVVTWSNDFSCTDGAAAAIDAAGNAGLVRVAFRAGPPNFAPCARDDVCRREGAVFRGVPLARQVWVKACKVVGPSLHLLMGTDRAVSAIDAGFDLRLPLVALLAAPPNDAMAAGQHLVGGKAAIFCGMPLAGNQWVLGGQIIFSRNGIASRAVRAATAAASPGMNSRLPAVPIGAAPPDMFLAATADSVRRERKVAFAVPLFEQVYPLHFSAIF